MWNVRLFLVGVTMALASEVLADPIALREAGDHLTEATVTIDATPAEIYAVVTDYPRWQAIFSDVSSLKVERGTREDARVRFHSKVFDHDVTVQFANQPDHQIRFEGVKGPPGGRARGTYLLEPVAGGKTRVVATLYLDVVGLPGVFVSGGKLRHMREVKLRTDITDVMRAVAQRRESVHAAR